MRIIHDFRGQSEKNSENPQFLMKNKKGEFCLFSSQYNISKYNGYYFREDNEMYRSVEDIRPDEERTVIRDKHQEIFSFDNESFSFNEHLRYSSGGWARLIMDSRKIFDFDTEGRFFDIIEKDDLLLIRYRKEGDYYVWTAISGIEEYEETGRWIRREYSFDRKREDDKEWYVYDCLRFKGKVRIASALSESRAREKLNKKKGKGKITKPNEKIKDKDVRIAYDESKKALERFIVNIDGREGIYAGLPWFFQFWTRDMAISAGALIETGNKEKVRSLLKELELLPDGRLPNRYPDSELGSADSPGWFFRRASQAGMDIEKKLLKSIERIENNYMKDGLVYNKAKETWMDTTAGNDTREGFRIEIQAMMLMMYSLAKGYSKRFSEKEKDMRERVRKEFFREDFLYDGRDDSTIRPNIFIAYYMYPRLLSREEWKRVFDKSLGALWLEWGGLSTIEKGSELFSPDHTGQDNKSYHRGDSWFFINNMTARCLAEFDKDRYKHYIKKILKASSRDILQEGIIGEHSELSSASGQRAEGSLAQAWSSAMFIELVNSTENI
ncbi:MAG: amylo-alpha-1,6-glucosidase [Nanobdellota archaeon]